MPSNILHLSGEKLHDTIAQCGHGSSSACRVPLRLPGHEGCYFCRPELGQGPEDNVAPRTVSGPSRCHLLRQPFWLSWEEVSVTWNCQCRRDPPLLARALTRDVTRGAAARLRPDALFLPSDLFVGGPTFAQRPASESGGVPWTGPDHPRSPKVSARP